MCSTGSSTARYDMQIPSGATSTTVVLTVRAAARRIRTLR
jgi:hypothetical protein